MGDKPSGQEHPWAWGSSRRAPTTVPTESNPLSGASAAPLVQGITFLALPHSPASAAHAALEGSGLNAARSEIALSVSTTRCASGWQTHLSLFSPPAALSTHLGSNNFVNMISFRHWSSAASKAHVATLRSSKRPTQSTAPCSAFSKT